MEILTLLGMFITAIPLLFLWSWRGGSLNWKEKWPKLVPSFPQIIDRALTPAFIVFTLLFGLGFGLLFQQWIALFIGFCLFLWGTIPGWGNQMDLGKNDKPDTEWGHSIRDMFFKSKSSFSRDLVGLYMRMAWFYLPAIAWWFVNPIISLIPLSLAIIGPLIWVAEHRLYWSKNKTPHGYFGDSWVEDTFGVMIFTFTVIITLILIFV